MQVILLKFGPNKSDAPEYMDGHKAWIKEGMDDGVFHMVGSLDIGGGFILANDKNKSSLEDRLEKDPFVEHDIVSVETYQVDINQASDVFSLFVNS